MKLWERIGIALLVGEIVGGIVTKLFIVSKGANNSLKVFTSAVAGLSLIFGVLWLHWRFTRPQRHEEIKKLISSLTSYNDACRQYLNDGIVNNTLIQRCESDINVYQQRLNEIERRHSEAWNDLDQTLENCASLPDWLFIRITIDVLLLDIVIGKTKFSVVSATIFEAKGLLKKELRRRMAA